MRAHVVADLLRDAAVMLILAATIARANVYRLQQAVVVGGSVVVRLGAVHSGRVGRTLDLSWQTQGYLERAKRIDGVFTVWAEERPAPSYGPVAHVGRTGGAWFSSLGARLGYEWPLRVGLQSGWWPGPALTVEVGPVIATDGLVGLGVDGVVEAPWSRRGSAPR